MLTDGFGHAWAYMDDSVLYTVVIWHPLFGQYPVVLPDQSIGGGAGGGNALTPFAGTPLGTINGTNTVFTVTLDGVNPLLELPSQITAWLNFPLVQGVGYTLSQPGGAGTNVEITYTVAPQPGDTIYAQGLYVA